MLHALPGLTESEPAGLAIALIGESPTRLAATLPGSPHAASQAARRAHTTTRGTCGLADCRALRSCHHALELDGRTHEYTADEWLPAVYDIAAALLNAARLDREPPSFVEHAEQAVSWLSSAIADLDQDAPGAAAAIVDGLGRMLALHIFAGAARKLGDNVER